jgi:hypothetical protein
MARTTRFNVRARSADDDRWYMVGTELTLEKATGWLHDADGHDCFDAVAGLSYTRIELVPVILDPELPCDHTAGLPCPRHTAGDPERCARCGERADTLRHTRLVRGAGDHDFIEGSAR